MLALLTAWIMANVQAPPPIAAGIPRTMAQLRAARIADLRYDLRFVVPAAATEPLAGTEVIRFTLKDTSDVLPLDFAPGSGAISSLRSNGATVDVTAVNGHVLLPPQHLRAGANEVALAFTAGDASLNRNPDF